MEEGEEEGEGEKGEEGEEGEESIKVQDLHEHSCYVWQW